MCKQKQLQFAAAAPPALTIANSTLRALGLSAMACEKDQQLGIMTRIGIKWTSFPAAESTASRNATSNFHLPRILTFGTTNAACPSPQIFRPNAVFQH
jgi:hypothetical protein